MDNAPPSTRTRSNKREKEQESSLLTDVTKQKTARKKLRIEIAGSGITPRQIFKPLSSKKQIKDRIALENLPDSLISNCLFSGYLDSKDIIQTLMQVNRHLRRVACESVTLLDLRGFKRITSNDMDRLVRNFRNLSEIDLNYCHQIGNSHIAKFVPLAHSLKKLRLRGTAVTDRGVERSVAKLVNLEELDLSKTTQDQSTRISDSSVNVIAASCPMLRSLLLGWCVRISDHSIRNLSALLRLEEVDLSFSKLTTDVCSSLASLNLKRLDISATTIDCTGVKLLSQPTISFAGITKKIDCELQVLKLRHAENVKKAGLRHLALHAKKLQLLDISYCGNIDLDLSDVNASINYLNEHGAKVLTEENDELR